MKKTLTFQALTCTLLTGVICSAYGAEKITLEQAIESHKQNLPEKGISSAESKASWDAADHLADVHSGKAKVNMVYAELWSSPNPNGSVSGDFILSESFRNYDEIVVMASYAGKGYTQHFRFSPREYDDAVLRSGQAVIWEREREAIAGHFLSDNKTFTRTLSTGYIYKIYGISYK